MALGASSPQQAHAVDVLMSQSTAMEEKKCEEGQEQKGGGGGGAEGAGGARVGSFEHLVGHRLSTVLQPTVAQGKRTTSQRYSQRAAEAMATIVEADSVAFMWQTILIPILCSIPSIAALYMISNYTRAVGNLYFGEDGLGAPAIYRKPPQMLHLPEGSHLAIAPFLPFMLLKYGVEPPGLDAFHDSFSDGYAPWKHYLFYTIGIGSAAAIPNLLFVLAFFRPKAFGQVLICVLFVPMTAFSTLLAIRWYDDGFEFGDDNGEEKVFGSVVLSSFILVFIASLFSQCPLGVKVSTIAKLKVGAVINCGVNLFCGALVIVYLQDLLPLFFNLDATFPATQSMLFKCLLRNGLHTVIKKAVLEVSTYTLAVAGHASTRR